VKIISYITEERTIHTNCYEKLKSYTVTSFQPLIHKQASVCERHDAREKRRTTSHLHTRKRYLSKDAELTRIRLIPLHEMNEYWWRKACAVWFQWLLCGLFNDAATISHFSVEWRDDSWIGKYLEGRVGSLIEELSGYISVGTWENHDKHQAG
jgi:hypothetical protein